MTSNLLSAADRASFSLSTLLRGWAILPQTVRTWNDVVGHVADRLDVLFRDDLYLVWPQPPGSPPMTCPKCYRPHPIYTVNCGPALFTPETMGEPGTPDTLGFRYRKARLRERFTGTLVGRR